ncbi:TIM barrel protein [Paenibacillus senegalensis]|uniref:TIM barrel protein n=1 Tax=Paenibacillus senegalensis TaxID=1465766 RepID=UPI000289FA49|nr:TIM barrel protein [Paenibacillus senegalensis]
MKWGNMKLANMNQHYHRYPLTYFLDSTVRVGLQAIELWGGTPHLYVDDAKPADVKKVLKEIRSRDLEIVCFTPEQAIYPINLSAKDDTCRNRSIDYFKRCLEVTRELECSKLLVIAGFGFYNEPEEEAFARGRDSLQQLAREAEKTDVTLVLEAMSPIGSNVIYNLETLKKMYKAVDSPSMKVMLDTVLMAVSGDTIDEYASAFGEDLVHFHFIDGDGQTTAHLGWGEGSFPLQEFKASLERMNYQGYLTLELISPPKYNWDPEAGIRKSLEALGVY